MHSMHLKADIQGVLPREMQAPIGGNFFPYIVLIQGLPYVSMETSILSRVVRHTCCNTVLGMTFSCYVIANSLFLCFLEFVVLVCCGISCT